MHCTTGRNFKLFFLFPRDGAKYSCPISKDKIPFPFDIRYEYQDIAYLPISSEACKSNTGALKARFLGAVAR